MQKAAGRLKEFLILNAGTLLLVAGVYFFKFPNNFSTGGVTGLSIILSPFVPAVTPGTLVFFINMVLLAVGFLFLGRSFGMKTVYSSILMSVSLWALERIFPMEAPLTDQPFLELMFAVALPAFGSALLFNIDASTGGTDIVAMLLRKFTSLNIGRALLATDVLITASACFVFGIETGLFSILGLMMKSLMVDTVIENINLCKCFSIVCDRPEPVCEFITGQLGRSATVWKAEGGFTHSDRFVVMTAMSRRQAIRLRRFIREAEPHAFMMITNTSEIIGKGFRGV